MDALSKIIYNFFIAFGVMLGSCFFAGLAALLLNHPPLKTMIDIGRNIKIWAIAISLGGTFSSFEILEKSILKREMISLIKQVLYIISALIGANCGYALLKYLGRISRLWLE
ncbi:YtrH family sporulation protein [Clostridium sp. D2Q-14]|uniref:YtrH family sporulation protein n=1 Tax=Anaeromonas gelatinilytica TaxID=2683194 RepID=UPI00193BCB1C|nr:YtrH family sporulation protein [Anaeromonas gelatinilytica]MBS4534825.1 YtrH family sporulation protein [Anaeromonas gelatinilytica]